MTNPEKEQRGLSLIELFIVVVIILTIEAIAIPNLLRSRMAASESSTVASIRTINTGMIAYNSTYPTVGFATLLSNLGGTAPCTPTLATGCLIDSVLGNGTKSGYKFVAAQVAGTPSVSYYASGNPITLNQTGIRVSGPLKTVVRVDPAGGNIVSVGTCEGLLPLNQ